MTKELPETEKIYSNLARQLKEKAKSIVNIPVDVSSLVSDMVETFGFDFVNNMVSNVIPGHHLVETNGQIFISKKPTT